jgi:uncharacterized protein
MTAADPRPLPDRRGATAIYWEGVQNGKLLFQRCSRCEASFFPARVVCPHCGSEEVSWFESAGKGTVYSHSTVQFHPNPAYSHLVPYVVALVDVEPGCRVATNLVDCDPTSVQIGMEVEVVYRNLRPDFVAPYFRPVTKGGDKR